MQLGMTLFSFNWHAFDQVIHHLRWFVTCWLCHLTYGECHLRTPKYVSLLHEYTRHLCMLSLAASRANTGTPKFLSSWTGWGDCDLLCSRRSRVDRTFRLHLTSVYLTSCTMQLLASSSNQFTTMCGNEPLYLYHSLLHVFDAVSMACGVRRLASMQHFVFRWC